MNDKVKNVLLLTILGAVAYFVWKNAKTTTVQATSNTSVAAASTNNLIAPITGLIGVGGKLLGAINGPINPATLPTSLDDLHDSIHATNGVGSSQAFDNSGGAQDDEGNSDDAEAGGNID